MIGCGGIACQYHLRVLTRLPGVEVLAVADPRPEARARAAALAGADAVADASELLGRDDVDAVVICADTRAHADLAQAAAGACKHFYLEKPIALSADDGRRAVDAAKRNGVTAAMGFNFRFHPLHLRARQLLRDGRIGRVRSVWTRYWEPVPSVHMKEWKRRRATGGGVLLELGSHHVDLLRWFLGEEIERIEDSQLESRETEHDSARFRARTSSGAVVEAELSYRLGRSCEWEFVGVSGRLLLDRHAGSVRVLAADRRRRNWPWADTVRARLRALPVPRRDPTFALSLGAFVEHLCGSPRELPTLTDGLRSLEMLLEAEAVAGAH